PGEIRTQEILPNVRPIKLPLGWATGKDDDPCDLGCGGEGPDIMGFSLQMCPWGFRKEYGVDRAQLTLMQSRMGHIVEGE
ncbi:hypothetical protein ACQP3F_33565, partial [Escherichia coli]